MNKEEDEVFPTITHWNYRVIKRSIKGNVVFSIHEVYFDGDDIVTISTEPMNMVEYARVKEVSPSPVDELVTAANMALDACARPIIDWDTLDLTEDIFPGPLLTLL